MACPYCGSSNITQHDPFAVRILPGGNVPKVNDLLKSYRCHDCNLMTYEKQLSSGVRVITSHIAKEARSKEDAHRVIVRFISDDPEENMTIKEFYIWVENTYIQDRILHLDHFAKKEEVLRSAILLAAEEYAKTGNTPSHNGMDCRSEWKCCKQINNTENYGYPVTTP